MKVWKNGKEEDVFDYVKFERNAKLVFFILIALLFVGLYSCHEHKLNELEHKVESFEGKTSF